LFFSRRLNRVLLLWLRSMNRRVLFSVVTLVSVAVMTMVLVGIAQATP
jgi:hypothetical protein